MIFIFRNLEAEQARANLTNAEVANMLGISRVTYEKKKKTGNFNFSEVIFLLAKFGVSFEYLFATENESS